MPAAAGRGSYHCRMTSAVVARRRVLVGGGAVAGLAALTRCAYGGDAASSVSGGTLTTSTTPTPTASPSPVAAPSGSARPAPAVTPSVATARLVDAPVLADRIEDLMESRGGALGLEVVDLRRGESFRVTSSEAYCYSTIKVLILTTALRQAQEDGKELTKGQLSLARKMITRSDNSATETLLAEVGRDEVQRVADLVGMDHTEIDSGWWGFWRTRPQDLDQMVDALLSSDRVLDGTGRATARFLMADVVPAQRWGVFTAEKRDGVYVAGKNGWGPLPNGYHVNTTGWVTGPDVEYVLSIISRSTNGFSHGRETVGSVAGLCHDALRKGLA